MAKNTILKSLPGERNTYVDPELSALGLALMNDPASFAALKAAPLVNVDTETGKYPIFSDFLRTEAKPRGYGETVAERGYEITRGSYDCQLFAVGHPVYNRSNASAWDKAEMATRLVTQDLLLKLESAFAATAFVAASWSTSYNGKANLPVSTTGWDQAASTPIKDIDTAARAIQIRTGRRPNTIVMGRPLFDILKEHSTVRDRFQYVIAGTITVGMLEGALGMTVVVCDSVIDSSNEGQTANNDFVVGNNAVLMHVSSTPDMDSPSAMYAISADLRGTGQALNVRAVEDPQRDLVMFEAEAAVDFKVTSADLGAIFLNPLGA